MEQSWLLLLISVIGFMSLFTATNSNLGASRVACDQKRSEAGGRYKTSEVVCISIAIAKNSKTVAVNETAKGYWSRSRKIGEGLSIGG